MQKKWFSLLLAVPLLAMTTPAFAQSPAAVSDVLAENSSQALIPSTPGQSSTLLSPPLSLSAPSALVMPSSLPQTETLSVSWYRSRVPHARITVQSWGLLLTMNNAATKAVANSMISTGVVTGAVSLLGLYGATPRADDFLILVGTAGIMIAPLGSNMLTINRDGGYYGVNIGEAWVGVSRGMYANQP